MAEKPENADKGAEGVKVKDMETSKSAAPSKRARTIWVYTTVVFAIFSIFLLAYNASTTGLLTDASTTGLLTASPSVAENPQDVANKSIGYINSYLLGAGSTATLVNVTTEKGLYKIVLNIGGKEYDSYVTTDGALLFPSTVDMTQTPAQTTDQTTTPQNITKSDKPTVDLYVMSFCPYGNKAEDTLYPVYSLLKDKVDWSIHYIVSANGDAISSLHGQPEVDEDKREVCVKRDYGLDAYWKFVEYVNKNCGSDGSCWKDAAKDAGADADKVQACFDKDGLALLKAEAAATSAAGASGSPTMFINGVTTQSVYQYGQSDAYKDTICSAFTTAPSECATALNNTASTVSGSCG